MDNNGGLKATNRICASCGKELISWETTCPFCGEKQQNILKEGFRTEEREEFAPGYDPKQE